MTLADRYHALKKEIHQKAIASGRDPGAITLVVVTKQQPIEKIRELYDAGCRDFGENRVQEALPKMAALPDDIRWHFIGTLQSNKINKVVGAFHLIHSVDNPELAEKISETSQRKGIITPILLEVNTSQEASKHGLSAEEWLKHLEEMRKLPAIRIQGLMTMAPYTDDTQCIRSCFKKLGELQKKDPERLQDLSMGMSNDYLIAIEEGATLLRIGSAFIISDI